MYKNDNVEIFKNIFYIPYNNINTYNITYTRRCVGVNKLNQRCSRNTSFKKKKFYCLHSTPEIMNDIINKYSEYNPLPLYYCHYHYKLTLPYYFLFSLEKLIFSIFSV